MITIQEKLIPVIEVYAQQFPPSEHVVVLILSQRSERKRSDHATTDEGNESRMSAIAV